MKNKIGGKAESRCVIRESPVSYEKKQGPVKEWGEPI